MLVGFAVTAFDVESFEAAVIGRQFLFDDVRLNRHAEMICLSGQIGGRVKIFFLGFECRIAKITPQNRRHSEFVGVGKSL